MKMEEKEKERSIKVIRKYKYIGESNRSCYEREYEHQQAKLKPGSHMIKHLVDRHDRDNFNEAEFRMKAVRFHNSSFERQIHEAVLIQTNRDQHSLLNSRSEFNRNAIPRLGLKMGDKEYNENGKEKKEAGIEEEILAMRKEKNKEGEQRRPHSEQPARERQRLAEERDKSDKEETEEITI